MLRFGSLCGRLSLFVSGLSSHSRIFYSYVEVIIISEGLQILTYARYLWPLSSEVRTILSVLHLLSHGASVYNGNLRGPIRLTAVAERLAVELLQPFLKTYVCRGWDSNTQPLLAGRTL